MSRRAWSTSLFPCLLVVMLVAAGGCEPYEYCTCSCTVSCGPDESFHPGCTYFPSGNGELSVQRAFLECSSRWDRSRAWDERGICCKQDVTCSDCRCECRAGRPYVCAVPSGGVPPGSRGTCAP